MTRISLKYLAILLLFSFLFNACKKESDTAVLPETSTVTDIDGNTYRTIKIGNQWWMAENFKCTKYRNGNLLESITATSAADWPNTKKGAFCSYDDKSENTKNYGRLYNWYAIVDSNNLAPEGWHIPSDSEWKILEKELGMSDAEANRSGWRGNMEGDKLKIEAPLGWIEVSPVWGNNESGFSALAGGCRLFNGTWANPGLFATGFWWSSTANKEDQAWYRNLDKNSSAIFRSHTYKNYGFSIRCVKD